MSLPSLIELTRVCPGARSSRDWVFYPFIYLLDIRTFIHSDSVLFQKGLKAMTELGVVGKLKVVEIIPDRDLETQSILQPLTTMRPSASPARK